MPNDDEIRQLCGRVVSAEGAAEFNLALLNLRVALREHFIIAENSGLELLLKILQAQAHERPEFEPPATVSIMLPDELTEPEN